MGQSTDALLMFGVDLGDGEDIEWPEALQGDDEDSSYPDLDGYLAATAGLMRPDTDNYEDPAWPAFWAATRALESACPVDLVSHCSGDYPMWVLALRRTVQRAGRGSPVEPLMSAISDGEVAALRSFCEATGLPWSEPKWLLCSNWN